MPYRDPRCVFVANDFGQADVVAGWLGGRGIPARVMNQATHGGLAALYDDPPAYHFAAPSAARAARVPGQILKGLTVPAARVTYTQ